VHVSILFLILKTTQGKEEKEEGDMPALEKADMPALEESNALEVQKAHTITEETTKVWRPTLLTRPTRLCMRS
jgi:hypothetical protein